MTFRWMTSFKMRAGMEGVRRETETVAVFTLRDASTLIQSMSMSAKVFIAIVIIAIQLKNAWVFDCLDGNSDCVRSYHAFVAYHAYFGLAVAASIFLLLMLCQHFVCIVR
jgi:hypothetical protein